jgi:hypothetical protein
MERTMTTNSPKSQNAQAPNYGKPSQVLSADNVAVALAYLAKHPTRYLFPTIGDKRQPAIKDNLALASNDPGQLKAWQQEHERRGRVMWACAARKSGLIPLDADLQKPGAQEALDKLVGEIADDSFNNILDTETATTPSGGVHLIFEGDHKFSQSKLGAGLDVPNYFMIPGQMRSDGKRYKLTKDVPAMTAPAALQARVKPAQPERTRTFTADAVPLDLFKKMLAATPYTGGPAGMDDRHSYGGCLNFLMAAHEAAGGDEADYLEAVIDWCFADPNQDWTQPTSREWVERKWASFNDSAANAVTRASWFKVLDATGGGDLVGEATSPEDRETMRDDPANDNDIAQMKALANDSDPQEYASTVEAKPKERRNRLKGRSLVELMALPMPTWMIDGMIPDGGLFVLYGKPKRGKSFWALDLSLCVALGMDFFGEKVGKPGRVLYVAAEGGAAFIRERALKWCQAHNVDPADLTGRWELIDTGIALNLPESVKEFLEENRGDKCTLIVLDTLNRNMRGDENSQKDMSAAIKGADMIRDTTGATVGLVHHEGWSAKRVRGSSVLQGAPDAILRVARDKANFTTVVAEDMRDAASGKTQVFTLGTDGVLHLVPADEIAKRTTGNKVLDLLADLYESGDRSPVPVDTWRAAVKAAGLIDDGAGGTDRKKWTRALDALVKARRVKKDRKGDGYSPTVGRDDLNDDAGTDFQDDPVGDDNTPD